MLSPDDSTTSSTSATMRCGSARPAAAARRRPANIQIFGARDYSMRLWLNPDKIAQLGMTAGDVLTAIARRTCRSQAAKSPSRRSPIAPCSRTSLHRPPEGPQHSKHRAEIDTSAHGRLRDVARIELGALAYSTNSFCCRSPPSRWW